MAAIGRQLKQSVKVFQSLMLYLLLPEVNQKEEKEVKYRLKVLNMKHFEQEFSYRAYTPKFQ